MNSPCETFGFPPKQVNKVSCNAGKMKLKDPTLHAYCKFTSLTCQLLSFDMNKIMLTPPLHNNYYQCFAFLHVYTNYMHALKFNHVKGGTADTDILGRCYFKIS